MSKLLVGIERNSMLQNSRAKVSMIGISEFVVAMSFEMVLRGMLEIMVQVDVMEELVLYNSLAVNMTEGSVLLAKMS